VLHIFTLGNGLTCIRVLLYFCTKWTCCRERVRSILRIVVVTVVSS